jgi:hypothetical protein
MAKRAKTSHSASVSVDPNLAHAFGDRGRGDVVDGELNGYAAASIFLNALTAAAGDYAAIKSITGSTVIDGKPDVKTDGIYFSSGAGRASSAGHFIAVRGGVVLDSYRMRLQKDGSDGFCQSFAMMNYLGLTPMFGSGSAKFGLIECSRVVGTWLASQCIERNKAFVDALHVQLGPHATCNKDASGKDHPSIWWYRSTEKKLADRAADYAEQIIALTQSPFFADALQKQMNFF